MAKVALCDLMLQTEDLASAVSMLDIDLHGKDMKQVKEQLEIWQKQATNCKKRRKDTEERKKRSALRNRYAMAILVEGIIVPVLGKNPEYRIRNYWGKIDLDVVFFSFFLSVVPF